MINLINKLKLWVKGRISLFILSQAKLTPKGECALDYFTKIAIGTYKDSDFIQAYEDVITQMNDKDEFKELTRQEKAILLCTLFSNVGKGLR